MPTPDRTSLSAIVSAAGDLLESDGLPAVTMAAVAARVGVRAPSLYKRLRNRDELIEMVAEAALGDLRERLARAVGAGGDGAPVGDPRARLEALIVAAREFARVRPAAFRLVFAPGDLRLDPALLAATSAPLFDVVAELAGPRHALQAARTVTAWATGFILMELSSAFRLGGDLDEAFDYGIRRLAEAITDR
ncbi:TetR/AcrR family transcriptional regulator [Modestobacter roseus]|uniref:TetR/AcrR family transcriptional regulator n=1 Tax=Modestobacter roseus TaxID=1181884 RepID=UPI0012963B57|nr:TetR/AcrR family transcriptional regulator [Modestobacter roseus]MQA32992.1 TetR family transcriptional regulator [Modestobacter roseus]